MLYLCYKIEFFPKIKLEVTIYIDNIELSSPVILAPMSGVTDLPYRKLVKHFGAGLVVSEMIASRAMIVQSHQSMKKSAILHDDATGACVQLAGCEPKVIADSAAKKVVGGYSGSALMKDEKLAAEILYSTVKAVKIPVTLKMRTGWDDNTKNAPIIAKIAEDAGIKMVTVHGRTRCQFYSGKADWEFISYVKKSIKIPVVANGDIVCFDSAKEALNKSGADGIMIGRGAYGKPWLISQVAHFLKTGKKLPDPPLKEQLVIVLNHYDDMINYYGMDAGVKLARKHLGWYSSGLPNSSEFRAFINRTVNADVVKEKIQEFYSSI
jgi:tRNA-dihydrouridine synthase B